MHVAVGAAIAFFIAPVARKGFTHGALFFAPEVLGDDLDRLLQQGFGARTLRDDGRTGGQRDKGMQISSLTRIATRLRGLGEPAAMLGITQRSGQRGDTVIDQFGAAGDAVDMGQRETVGHAGGVHGLGHCVCWQPALIVQVAKPLRHP